MSADDVYTLVGCAACGRGFRPGQLDWSDPDYPLCPDCARERYDQDFLAADSDDEDDHP